MSYAEANLSALDALVAGATAGPWSLHTSRDVFSDDSITLFRPRGVGLELPDVEINADALFVCAARTALPALIAELREARERIAKVTQFLQGVELVMNERCHFCGQHVSTFRAGREGHGPKCSLIAMLAELEKP